MPTAINLVCTRCTDANPAALQRWYNDHAQLLMVSHQLQRVELFRFDQTTASINYFCLYHFAQLADFSAFDCGDVMSQVRDLSNAAPGRSSVEMVKRTQYERLIHRVWLAQAHGARMQASLFTLPSDHLPTTTRWLNDVLYALHLAHPLHTAQVYATSEAGQTELFVLLQSASSHPLPSDWHTLKSSYATRPSIQLHWQALSERVAQWLR